MRISFARDMTIALSKSFFYCPERGAPSIQVGKIYEKDIIFWLKYNDEAVNKCAGDLIKELGEELGVSDIQSAKKILLDFSSYAFNAIDADFLSFNAIDRPVSDIFSELHKDHLSMMFEDYIQSKKVMYPYIYTIHNTEVKGVCELNDNLYLYGSGEIDRLLNDINIKTGIEIPRDFLDEKAIFNEPICRFARLTDVSVALVYARSKDEAVEYFNRLFGALCLTINAPFRINQLAVDNRINWFNQAKFHEENIRVNLPAVYEIKINSSVVENLRKIFSSSDNRMNSALSFVAHGWTHDKRERFLNQFIALDALYGTSRDNKNSIVNGVCRDAITIEGCNSKIKTIYDLRSKFVHGEVSTFSAHGKYLKFVSEHGIDPIMSLFEILKNCALNYGGVYKETKDITHKNIRVPMELVPEITKMIEQYEKDK